MSAPLREQLVNDAVTTLNGAIDASQTSVVVAAGSVFPSTGNFRIKIEDEILICTARSTNTLTVVRGQEGTSGASHADTSTIWAPATAGGFLQLLQDNESGWGDTSAPPQSKIVDTNGTTVLVASDFTWLNQGSSSLTDQNGTLLLRVPPASGENVRGLYRSAPGTPWSVILGFQMGARRENVPNAGVMTRESGTGELSLYSMNVDSSGAYRPAAYHMNSATSFNTNIIGRNNASFFGHTIWIKVADNGTNVIFSMGFDGIEWSQLASHSRTAHMAGGPNQVGFYFNHFGSTAFNALMRINHWSYGS